MKTKTIMIGTLVICLVAFLTFSTYAQEIELRGGGSYITLSDDDAPDGGFGIYAGGKYNIVDALNAIGQYEKYFISDTIDGIDSKIDLNAIVSMASFDLMPENKTNLSLMGGPGFYFGSVSAGEEGMEISFDLKSSLGLKFGAALEHQLEDDINLNVGGFYRILEMGIDIEDFPEGEEADFNGLEFNGGITYSF